MNQQQIIVTEIAEVICYYPELAGWVREFDQDPDNPHFEPLSPMEGDPDIIRCNQDETYFIDIQRRNTTYILTSHELSNP